MDQSRIGSHRLSARVFGAALLGVLLFGAFAPAAADAQDLPPICRRRGVYDAIRTLIRFCPSGNCIPRAGIGDLLEQRVDPSTLQLIASDAALYPARVFYKAGRGRFDTTDVVSSDHLAHAQADLREVARTYQRYPNSKIIVLGRASQTGDMSTNVRLSQERARRVADYLHRTFNISYDDIHQAYFGSRLFQMQPGDLASLGIAADDLPARRGWPSRCGPRREPVDRRLRLPVSGDCRAAAGAGRGGGAPRRALSHRRGWRRSAGGPRGARGAGTAGVSLGARAARNGDPQAGVSNRRQAA